MDETTSKTVQFVALVGFCAVLAWPFGAPGFAVLIAAIGYLFIF